MSAGRFSVMSRVAATVLIVVIVSFGVIVQQSGTADALPVGVWSSPVQISSVELIRGDIDGNIVYEYGWSNLAVSDDGGATWDPEMSYRGHLDASEGTVHRVDVRDVPVLGTIVFMKSTDHGTTWSSPVVIMQESGNDGGYRIAKFDTTIIVYTFENAGTSYGLIKSSKSIDDGATWSSPVMVDPTVHCEDPLASPMVYLNGIVYMTYYNYSYDDPVFSDIIVIKSSDLGTSWEDRTVVGSGYTPTIAADSGSIYVTYWDDSGSGLVLVKSTDGDTWSSPVVVGDMINGTDPQTFHSICAKGGAVFVAYITYDNPGGIDEYWVHVNYSGDSGATWEDMGNVTGGDGDEMYPNVMFDGAKLHLTWIDAQGSGGWGGVTFYRSFTLNEPVPEFATLLLPIVGTALLVSGLVLARRR